MVWIQNKTNILSPPNPERCVLQGDVFSILLFFMAINDITENVKYPITQRLFADDYNISVRSSHPDRAHCLLQETLSEISTWLSKNGFRFSSLETYLIIF